jgi:hypothetical protein
LLIILLGKAVHGPGRMQDSVDKSDQALGEFWTSS